MSRRLLATAALGLAVTAVSAQAQTQLAIGQSLVGQLSGTDMVWSDGARYDMYVFYGTAGQYVQIDMQSTEFDSYLILQDQNGAELDRNDDFGGTLNSRIARTLSYTGSYRIIAKSLSSNRFGTYTISLTGSGAPTPAATGVIQDGVRGWITAGEMRSGNLSPGDAQLNRGAVYHAYLYNGRAGETVTLEVMSSSIDPYAVIQDGQGNALASDDDGGGSLQARLVYTFPNTATYRLLATTYGQAATYGPYTLRLSSNMAGMTQPMVTTGVMVPGAVGTIGLNQQISGTLTAMDQRFDNKPIHIYSFSCIAGLSFTMAILSSWDNYAVVIDPSGVVVARDDDSGGNLQARLSYTCPMTATYRLGVTTFTTSTQPGPYTLQVTSAGSMAPPVSQPQPVVGQAQPIVGQAQPMVGQAQPVVSQPQPVAQPPAAQPIAQPQA
ncbi:MAG TPA: hypothetical protein VNL98_09460, partial [Gemmatimonadales bacterium]|nr:hypothetical protein [Gemmatimonadales bacterium]